MSTLSVISSTRAAGSSPVMASAARVSSTSSASCNWRPERLTLTVSPESGYASRQRCTWAHASRSTQPPIRTICPVSSASGNEVLGQQVAVARVIPAHQRLEPEDDAGPEVHDGLIVEHQLLASIAPRSAASISSRCRESVTMRDS